MTYSNRDRHNENNLASLRVVGEWEMHVSEQRRLVADLKLTNQPVQVEEADLKRYEAALNQLRNHRETMQKLMTLDPNEKARAMLVR
jgi:hypothetical protein